MCSPVKKQPPDFTQGKVGRLGFWRREGFAPPGTLQFNSFQDRRNRPLYRQDRKSPRPNPPGKNQLTTIFSYPNNIHTTFTAILKVIHTLERSQYIYLDIIANALIITYNSTIYITKPLTNYAPDVTPRAIFIQPLSRNHHIQQISALTLLNHNKHYAMTDKQQAIQESLAETEKLLNRLEKKADRMEYDAGRDVLKHFDRLHDKLGTVVKFRHYESIGRLSR